MERARILNAAIMGVVPWNRYVLFSDALLEILSPEECEAVLAHEIGHSKHRHVLFYLLFSIGFVALAFLTLSALPEVFRAEFLFGMPVLAILVLVYFRIIFGYLSRAFERQADFYAAGLTGSPVPLMLALEKIALASGDVRELASWRHDSVARRVRRLSEAGYDDDIRARHDRSVRRAVRLVATGIVALFTLSWYVTFIEPEGITADIARWQAMAERRAFDYYVWTRLGELQARAGHIDQARTAFGRALANNPRSEAAMNGLSRLPLDVETRTRTVAAAYLEAGLPGEALAVLKTSTPGDERASPETLVLLSRALNSETLGADRDTEKALEAALAALRREEDADRVRPETHLAVAEAYVSLGMADQALDHAGRASDAGGEIAEYAQELESRIRAMSAGSRDQ
jgi:predicted Zn-dependent protease